MKAIGIILFVLLSICSVAQSTDGLKNYVLSSWEDFEIQEENAVKAILVEREKITEYIRANNPSDRVAMLENGNQALRRVAELYKNGKRDMKLKSSLLKKVLAGVDLTAKEIVQCDRLPDLVEGYYALKQIKEGTSVDQAWGGMWFNTTVETVGNDCDYQRYRQVLELNNPDLSLAYLGCLKQVFRYNGYTKGLDEIRPAVEKYMPESDLKKEVLGLYDYYYHLREGAVAPVFTLKDFKGKEFSLSDYRGKVLVIDVWATWCGGCIAKLPTFMAMRDQYKGREDIEFITISIDDAGVFKTWKYALPRLKLMDVTNLLASKESCSFSEDYNITGIPRYFLIDKEGKIVSVYAPTPGKDFESLINKTLNK